MDRLVLGCGKHHVKQPGELLLDKWPFPNVQVVHDLEIMPWPFRDNSFDSITACHLVEHLHCQLIPFMNECWRILRPGGSVYLETPLAGVDIDLEWADPTHVRCYRIHSFANYLSPEGVEMFGYTDKAWNFFVLRVKDNAVIVVHAYPLKK